MIKVGDKVLCRFYNTLDKHFYGDSFTATVRTILENDLHNKKYFVIPDDMNGLILRLDRKEIKRIIKG